jgi:hypothetical protein
MLALCLKEHITIPNREKAQNWHIGQRLWFQLGLKETSYYIYCSSFTSFSFLLKWRLAFLGQGASRFILSSNYPRKKESIKSRFFKRYLKAIQIATWHIDLLGTSLYLRRNEDNTGSSIRSAQSLCTLAGSERYVSIWGLLSHKGRCSVDGV